jgi:iron(III) transport system substrate-binding protein
MLKVADPDTTVANVISGHGSPPADVLLASSVLAIWRAADEGGLRPLLSEKVDAMVPATLRDPDGLWVAAATRVAAIAYDVRASTAAQLAGYESLAEPQFARKLCLTSSALASNRALIAMLIESNGERSAELLVRGWVRNLALPPMKSRQELIESVAAGVCSAGIVAVDSESGELAGTSVSTLRFAIPAPVYVDIDALGIARHAKNPEQAREFIEWLLTQLSPDGPAKDTVALPEKNVGIAGWYAEQAAQLAVRAAYR